MTAVERFELIYAIGAIIIGILVYVIAGIVFFVIASKKKQTNPKDAKNWKILGIIFMSIAGLILLGVGGAFIIPAILSDMAVFIM